MKFDNIADTKAFPTPTPHPPPLPSSVTEFKVCNIAVVLRWIFYLLYNK